MNKNELLLKNLNLINPNGPGGKISAENHREINTDIINYTSQVAGTGWTRDYVDEIYGEKIIRKVTGYYGGTGETPTEYIGLYFADDAFTNSRDAATDYRADITGPVTPLKTAAGLSPNVFLFGAGNVDNTGTGNFANGSSALTYNTTGSNNTAVGEAALKYSENNSNNTALGAYSLGRNLNPGSGNTAVGYSALYDCEGENNTGLGNGALQGVKGPENVAVGNNAGTGISTGGYNVSVGSGAGTTGDYSYTVALGFNAKATRTGQNVIGSANSVETIIFGRLRSGEPGEESTIFFGQPSQYNYFLAGSGREDYTNNTPLAYGNTAAGHKALENVYNSMMNTAMGHQALQKLTSGADHTAFGAGALQKQETGVGCTAMGRLAMANSVDATNNTGLGDTALEYNVAGNSNTAVGYSAGIKSGGSSNTLMGVFAGGHVLGKLKPELCTFNYCNAFGAGTLQGNENGDKNNVFGYLAGHRLTGSENSGFGHEALVNGVDISRNTAMGNGAGFWMQSGNDNVFIGHNAGRDGQVRNISGTTVLGATAYSTRDNEVVIGKAADTHATICGVEFSKAQLIALKALL